MFTLLRRVASTLGGLAIVVMVSAATESAAADWKMTSPWGGGPWLERDAKGFAAKVKELTNGRVNITVFAGGTLYSPLKVTEAVKKGVAEAGHNWMAYDWGIDKTAVLFAGYAGGLTPEAYMLWMYKGGGLELWQEFRKEEFGVISFPCALLGTEIFLHSKKKVTSIEDFKGLKLRTSGAWAEIASRLGASTVILPGAEVYNALERGVIDATEWGSPEINRPTGFNKIAKYVVTPGVHQPGGFLECEFNESAWNKLSKRDQDMIALAAKLTVHQSWLDGANEDMEAFAELESGANEIVLLEQTFIDKARAETVKWSDEQAANNAWFKKVHTSMNAFKERLKVWSRYRLPIPEGAN